MKRKYIRPKINIIEFEKEDIMNVDNSSTQGAFEILDHNSFTQ